MSADRLLDAVADHCAAIVMAGGLEPATAVHVVGATPSFLAGVMVGDDIVARGEGPTRHQALDATRAAFVAWSEAELAEEREADEGLERLASVAKVIPIGAARSGR